MLKYQFFLILKIFYFNLFCAGFVLNLASFLSHRWSINESPFVVFVENCKYFDVISFEFQKHGNQLIYKRVVDLLCNIWSEVDKDGNFSKSFLNTKSFNII